jgi:competence protein ComEA
VAPEAVPVGPPEGGFSGDSTRPEQVDLPGPGWMESWWGSRSVASRSAVAGALAVALLAAGLVGALIWRSRPQPVTVPPLSVAGSAGAAGPSSGARLPGSGATPPPTTQSAGLVIAVVGKVRRPGLVTVPAGSRLVDALRAAGGALPGVDITSLNQARRVVDGEQIVVGAPAVAGTGTGGAPGAPPGPVNLNTATLQQLDELPGVGPVLAQRIVDWRDEHAGFRSVNQLREVSGIGDRTFERLRTKVTV